MKKILYLLCVVALVSSCKKNQLNGNATIKGKIAHHGFGIADAKLYIKFKATEFPGDDVSAYDASVTADSEGNYQVNVYRGDYYLYGIGLDKRSSEVVRGGLAVHMRASETREVEVAVTE